LSRKQLDFSSDEVIIDVLGCANGVYGGGIAVPIDGGHPCGWEWIDFKDVEDILEHKFEDCEISDGCSNGDFTDKTLKEILKITEGKFAFEVNRNSIDWETD